MAQATIEMAQLRGLAQANGRRGAITRLSAVLVAAMALCWVAAMNGQPFIHPDSIGYVRGPEVALSKLFGPKVSTEWGRTNEKLAAAPPSPSGVQAIPARDPHEVLGGRSIYYGLLAFLGALTGGLWLTVVVQSLAIAYLADAALRAIGVRSLGAYAAIMAVLALATSAPFFAALIMPDIWAGLAIGALSLLFAAQSHLSRLDVVLLVGGVAFAAMAHSSVTPVLMAMAVAGGAVQILARKPAWLGAGAAILAILAAAAGGFAFTAMVKHTSGAAPINPPFLTARVIQDGTGVRFIRERCAQARFQVCNYADRLPIDADHFLWGATPKNGVFDTIGTPERRALSVQDARFALAAAKAYPVAQASASLRDAVLQTLDTDLSDFVYKPSLRDGYLHTLPPAALARAQGTMAWRETWPVGALWALQGLLALISLGVIGWSFLARGRSDAFGVARTTAGLTLVGVLANGLVCGVFSDLYGRYQARVEWMLPLAALLLIAAARRKTEI